MTDLTPQPGDRWTRQGFDLIEVVAVKHGDVYYTYDGKPLVAKIDEFKRLAGNFLLKGAVLRRDREIVSEELEDFEV